jgi:hypothetical protein
VNLIILDSSASVYAFFLPRFFSPAVVRHFIFFYFVSKKDNEM